MHGSIGTAKKITQMQRTALLAITSTMRSSPTDSLEVHANTLPGPLLIQHVLFNSHIRISTVPLHYPLNPIVTRIAKRSPVKRHQSALHLMIRNLAVDPRTIETIYPRPVHPNSHTPFATSIAASKDKAIAEFHQCTTRTMVFTNGSSTNGKVGAAASLYIDFEHIAMLRFHLGNDTKHMVFKEEAVSLILATRLLSSRNEATFPATIFADNQVVIRSGANPSVKPGHYLLLHFRKLVCHLQDKKDLDDKAISLNWIARHSDIEGNELADREAKLAALRKDKASHHRGLPKTLHKSLPQSTSATKQTHRSELQEKWCEDWQKSPQHPHIKALDPSHTPKSFTRLAGQLKKKHTALDVQLHTGHIPLNKHLHRIKRSATPMCLQCGDAQIESIHHFLFDCPRYNRE